MDDFEIVGIYETLVEEKSLYKDFCFVTGEYFQAYIRKDALQEIFEHVLQGLKENREVAGVLIGRFLLDKERKVEYVEIVNVIHARAGESSNIDVNIPAGEWLRMIEHVDSSAKYRGQYTVTGWYHSHPQMKAFMSAIDQSTQLRHFSHRNQVAIVVGLGMGIQDVKCFDNSSKQCPLYFIPDENDNHLLMASLDQVQGLIKKEIYNGYDTIPSLIAEVQNLRAEVERLKSAQIEQAEKLQLTNQNYPRNYDAQSDLTEANKPIFSNDSEEYKFNEANRNIGYWTDVLSQIFTGFKFEARNVEVDGKDSFYFYYPEINLGIGFHYGGFLLNIRPLSLDQRKHYISLDVSEIREDKLSNGIEQIKRILSVTRRKGFIVTSFFGNSTDNNIIRAQERCSRLLFNVQKAHLFGPDK